MARRVFLSILGIGFYEKCRYQKGNFLGSETTFVQQNLLEYLQEKEDWGRDDNDMVIMLLTKDAKKNNWNKNITSRYKAKEQKELPYLGLEKIFIDLGVSYKPVHIADGKDESQMWELFEVIFSQLEEGDHLYLDITNSFRYLPMLLVVLVNYAKLLKEVRIEAIYYGNYEARNKETNIAPIMDLLPLSSLQDWTSAASDYLQYGQVEKLHALSNQSLSPILRDPTTRTKDTERLRKFVNTLKETVDERITCRGTKIVEGKNIKYLKETASKIQDVTLPQLQPIFEKIKDSLTDFDIKENVHNSLVAAKWCFENKLYQQATTLLEEGLITILCNHYGLVYKEQADREIISSCIYIATNETSEDDWNVKQDTDKATINRILADKHVWENEDFLNLLVNVRNLRNDYNHAGFKKSAQPANTLIGNVLKFLESIDMAEKVLSTR